MRLGEESRLYKAVYADYQHDPLPSRSSSGRFHRADTGGVTSYLAASPQTAWREVRQRWRADPDAYRMVQVRVKVSKIVDLTDPATQTRYGVDREVLTGERYEQCQRLAARLRAEAVEAAWTFSRADSPQGRCLVLFLDLLAAESHVKAEQFAPLPADEAWTEEI